MKTLALECSSGTGSLALLEDDRLVWHRTWAEGGGRSGPLMTALDGLRAETGEDGGGIDLFAAGRGPGRYSGMRVAIAATISLALPGGKPVRTVGSGVALAHQLAAAQAAHDVFAVLGDARRERVWCGVLQRDGSGGLRSTLDWRLATVPELESLLPVNALIVSSEWTRLAPALEAADWFRRRAAIREDRYPDAEWVGRLAADQHRRAVPSEPATPIYLHPAVARADASN